MRRQLLSLVPQPPEDSFADAPGPHIRQPLPWAGPQGHPLARSLGQEFAGPIPHGVAMGTLHALLADRAAQAAQAEGMQHLLSAYRDPLHSAAEGEGAPAVLSEVSHPSVPGSWASTNWLAHGCPRIQPAAQHTDQETSAGLLALTSCCAGWQAAQQPQPWQCCQQPA